MITTKSCSLIREQRRQKRGAGCSGIPPLLQTTPESNPPEGKSYNLCIQTLLFWAQMLLDTILTLYHPTLSAAFHVGQKLTYLWTEIHTSPDITFTELKCWWRDLRFYSGSSPQDERESQGYWFPASISPAPCCSVPTILNIWGQSSSQKRLL